MTKAAARRKTLWPALVATAAALLAAGAAEASLRGNTGRAELLARPALVEALASSDQGKQTRPCDFASSDRLKQTRPFALDLAGSFANEDLEIQPQVDRPVATSEAAEDLANEDRQIQPQVDRPPFALFARPSRPANPAWPAKLASGILPWQPQLNVWRIRHFATIQRWATQTYAFVAWQPQMARDPMGECNPLKPECRKELVEGALQARAKANGWAVLGLATALNKLNAVRSGALFAASQGLAGNREFSEDELVWGKFGFAVGQVPNQVKALVEAAGPPPMMGGPIGPSPATALANSGVLSLPAKAMPLAMPMPLALPGGGTHYASSEPVASDAGEADPAVGRSGSAIRTAPEYEAKVRSLYGEVPFRVRQFISQKAGRLIMRVADNVARIADRDVAIEAKYVRDWATSIRNPNAPIASRSFAEAERAEVMSQARSYSENFGQVIYHTNSQEFIDYYSSVFKSEGINNITFILTPL